MKSIVTCPTTQILKSLIIKIYPSFPLAAGDVQSGVHSGVPGGGWLTGGQASRQPHLADPAGN